MHPIHSRNFGPGKIPVRFHNGTSLVDGYVIKQTGTITYIVSDGTVKKVVKLAQTTELAKLLTGETSPTPQMPLSLIMGLATIVTNTGYVKKLMTNTMLSTTNVSQKWTAASLIPAAPVPPVGFVFLTDADGAYLTDSDKSYLMEAI